MIKRYNAVLCMDESGPYVDIQDDDDGPWVKFEDHEREVQKLTPETKSYYSPHDSEENITDNPKSWIAWKKRSEQLSADKRELVEMLQRILDEHEIHANDCLRDDLFALIAKHKAT